MPPIPVLSLGCRHLGGFARREHDFPASDIGITWACTAFPDGIPAEITHDQVQHQSPYPGDHRIQFGPR